MSEDDGPKAGPLWKFVPVVGDKHVPSIKRSNVPTDPRIIPRDPSADEMTLLRTEGEWRPAVILKRFGPSKQEGDHLPRLIVACAILQGPHRVYEMADRLLAMLHIGIPRIERMAEDPSLERRRTQLKNALDRMSFARTDLPSTRARAANDLDMARPDGLRYIDLDMLSFHSAAVIQGSELATKRNLTGIDYAIHVATSPPDQRYAEDWVERVLGAPLTDGSGILLFTPADYGRVLIVHADGRLAYDPGAAREE